MKYKIRQSIQDKKTMQRLYMVSVGAALLVLALVVRDIGAADTYIKDEKGRITAIQWSEDEAVNECRLKLTVESENDTSERELTIRKRSDRRDNASDMDDEEMADAKRETEISNMISDIELSDRKKIVLPVKLSDGSRLRWEAQKKDRTDYFLIPLIYIVLVLCIVKSNIDKPKQQTAAKRSSIISGLPRFCNQILLTLNAGMILSDAFDSICSSYSKIPVEKRNFFEQSMIEIEEKNRDHRTSTAQLLADYANEYNVKEMIRIATILTENEKRGSDIVESLQRESSFLWENRKIIATERGKALDAKMAYPLGLLLIILVVITIAPAFLNM